MYLTKVHSTITGDFSSGVTPVLIPNTEVKTTSAEDTCLETSRESRSLPVFPIKQLKRVAFFIGKMVSLLLCARAHVFLKKNTTGSTRRERAATCDDL